MEKHFDQSYIEIMKANAERLKISIEHDFYSIQGLLDFFKKAIDNDSEIVSSLGSPECRIIYFGYEMCRYLQRQDREISDDSASNKNSFMCLFGIKVVFCGSFSKSEAMVIYGDDYAVVYDISSKNGNS